ncbi:hypothetical protein JKF63_02308 [Porcisia hertigi]|uniref:Uncharacterized protein n=1 Tax=Porcisia hertigi TaxID=2761500 RepID=A0A836IIE8_9TRYP|nr:hypothetical protein JKF63_02308 [Porcisia hertigi]
MTLPASAGDAGTVVSSAFTSQLTKSTIPVVGEAIWKENLQSPSALSQGSMNSFGTGDEKEDSDSATTLCVVSPNMSLAQEPRHHDNRICAASLSKEATLVRNSEYSMRDIHRGTWIFALARKECLARESLEAEETAEALRCLPASCAIWRTYCDHASGRASYDVESLSKSLDMNTYLSSDASNHAAVFGRTADCVFPSDRRSLGTKEAEEVKEPPTPPPHPAFVMAARRLELLEGIRRGYVTAEEEDEFQANLQKPYVYEHRLFVVGTLRLEGFLRPWVVIHRARKLRHARQMAKLQKLEQEARVALHATSHTLQRRFQLFMTALLEQEHHYRHALELLYTYQAARTGAVLLHLQEQAERFPLAYGAVMSRARVCGRVTGLTLFSNLSIAEQAIRKTIIDEEARRRAMFPTEFDMTALCLVHEVLRRRELVNCEANEHAMVQQVVRSLQAHYSIREVEIEESIERQFWLKGRTHGGTDPVVASASP